MIFKFLLRQFLCITFQLHNGSHCYNYLFQVLKITNYILGRKPWYGMHKLDKSYLWSMSCVQPHSVETLRHSWDRELYCNLQNSGISKWLILGHKIWVVFHFFTWEDWACCYHSVLWWKQAKFPIEPGLDPELSSELIWNELQSTQYRHVKYGRNKSAMSVADILGLFVTLAEPSLTDTKDLKSVHMGHAAQVISWVY